GLLGPADHRDHRGGSAGRAAPAGLPRRGYRAQSRRGPLKLGFFGSPSRKRHVGADFASARRCQDFGNSSLAASGKLKASFGRMEHGYAASTACSLPPQGRGGGVRGFTIEGLGPPHPHPLPAGERESRRAANRSRAHHEGLDRNERNML